MTKSLTLSIVIPIYNEERYLKACLDSIASQILPPDEVIVVDNNSTDKSLEIAKRYKFVKIMHEPRQHQVYAQVTGFNAAKGDIIGRIDADSVLPNTWVETAISAFTDPKTVAITGPPIPYDVPLKWLAITVFRTYIFIAGAIAGHSLLWGANCAIRKSAWGNIKDQVLMRNDIWEDYDMSFCLRKVGKISYIRKLKMGASFRAVYSSFSKYTDYQFRSVRTFYYRTNLFRLGLFTLLWSTTFLLYPVVAIDRRLQNSRS
jgi:glycosyltransferase involved in cell wall biosynthesis